MLPRLHLGHRVLFLLFLTLVLLLSLKMTGSRTAAAVAFVAYCFADVLFPPELEESLVGKIAVVTGGSRGSGRGFAQGLSEAGVTV